MNNKSFQKKLSFSQKLFLGILSFFLFALMGLIDWKKIAKTEQLGDCVLGETTFTLTKKDCKKGVFIPHEP